MNSWQKVFEGPPPQAAIVAGRLCDAGVPVQAPESALGNAGVYSPALQTVVVYVPADRAEEARKVLADEGGE